MSARSVTEVTCDGCNFTVPDYANATRIRADLRSKGWAVSLPDGRDLCPDCRTATRKAATQ